MYKEAAQTRRWPFTLALMVLAVVLPVCGMLEVSQSEAEYAVAARQIVHEHGWFIVTDGLPPLPLWILAFVGRFVALHESTVRLVLFIPMVGTAAAVAWVGHRIGGRGGAAVAAATVITSSAATLQISQGSGDTWFCLLINGAWLTWFYFVRENKNWFLAWILALALVGLATMAGGPKALLYFYLPLCFMRRPLTIWRRLVQVEHVVSLAAFILVAIGLIVLIPGMSHNFGAFVAWSPFVASLTPWYPVRLLVFPIIVGLGLMPWAFLLWPGYCAAFKPLERYPVLGQYLRTIMLSLAAFYLLVPGGRPGNLLPLLGPASLVVAMNYELLVRRHGRPLQLLQRVLAYVAFGGVAVGALAGLLVWGGWLKSTTDRAGLFGAGVCLLVSLLLGVLVLVGRQRWPIWQVIALGIGAVHLALAGVAIPYQLAHHTPHRDFGRALTAGLPQNVTINIATNDGHLTPADLFYLDRPLNKFDASLPYDLEGGNEVYVLKHSSVPENPFREWQSVSSYDLDLLRYRLWRGTPRPPAPLRPASDRLPLPEPPLPTLP